MNKSTKTYMIVFLTLLFLFFILFFIDFFGSDYQIFLDGEEVKEIVKCDTQWNYQSIIEFQELVFIPCVWNETLKARYDFNWTLSPQENCWEFNATFNGFNFYNETLAKERYDLVSPKCYEISNKDIDEEFLEDCECVAGKLSLVETMAICSLDNCSNVEDYINCLQYKCSENLVIEKR